MGKHRYTVIVVGLAASAVFIYFAVRNLNFGALADAWSNADLFPWVPLAIVSYLAGHLLRGQRCRLLVRRTASLNLMTASNIVVVGYASNNVVPARLGELVRAGMLAERTGMPIAQSLAVTFIERVLDGLAILFLLFIGTMAGDVPGWIHDLVRIALVVFGAASIVMLAGAHSPGLIIGATSRIGNKLGPKWHDRLVALATSITNAGACLRDPRDAFMLALYSIIVWTLEAGMFVAILPVFGIEPTLQDGFIAMSVTNLGLLVPSSPGFVGPFHYFASQAVMATHGVDANTAFAYATLVHLTFYIPVTLWGAGAMLWYGVEVGSTAAIAREARRSRNTATTIHGVPYVELADVAPVHADTAASAFTTGLVEAMVVGEGKTPQPEAVRYAATFVDGQLKALPPRLALLFSCGMTFFRFVTRLRFLRGYCNIPLEARKQWTLRWAENRVALFRQLFKPVRATALLAYYDHDAVKRELLAGGVIPAHNLVREPVPALERVVESA
ncbi:MAG: lysylphosphatidylglycerol synthase transmembrane domain-containing protein [Kofleriaceae bacterium]